MTSLSSLSYDEMGKIYPPSLLKLCFPNANSTITEGFDIGILSQWSRQRSCISFGPCERPAWHFCNNLFSVYACDLRQWMTMSMIDHDEFAPGFYLFHIRLDNLEASDFWLNVEVSLTLDEKRQILSAEIRSVSGRVNGIARHGVKQSPIFLEWKWLQYSLQTVDQLYMDPNSNVQMIHHTSGCFDRYLPQSDDGTTFYPRVNHPGTLQGSCNVSGPKEMSCVITCDDFDTFYLSFNVDLKEYL